MEIKKQAIENGFIFNIGPHEFMAYRDKWWTTRTAPNGWELVEPEPWHQDWLDTFTSIIKGS